MLRQRKHVQETIEETSPQDSSLYIETVLRVLRTVMKKTSQLDLSLRNSKAQGIGCVD